MTLTSCILATNSKENVRAKAATDSPAARISQIKMQQLSGFLPIEFKLGCRYM